MPPFVDVSNVVKADIEAHHDESGLILTNTRIVHVVVWATGIPMQRFVTEMNPPDWASSLTNIDPRVRWAITEEGDQLWNAQGRWLTQNWIEIGTAKTDSTGRVHLL